MVCRRNARAQARRQFGNTLLIRESSRDIKLWPRLESILRDVGFGLRLCLRNKTVTAAAVVSLSLAIGACTAAFSLIDALILRPLPVNDPRSLIYIALRVPGENRDGLSFNYPLFVELRDASVVDRRRQHRFGTDCTFVVQTTKSHALAGGRHCVGGRCRRHRLARQIAAP